MPLFDLTITEEEIEEEQTWLRLHCRIHRVLWRLRLIIDEMSVQEYLFKLIECVHLLEMHQRFINQMSLSYDEFIDLSDQMLDILPHFCRKDHYRIPSTRAMG